MTESIQPDDEAIVVHKGLPPGSTNWEALDVEAIIGQTEPETQLQVSGDSDALQDSEDRSREKEQFTDWVNQVVTIGMQVNENIEAVNEVGGMIKHPGISRSFFLNVLSGLDGLETSSLDQSVVEHTKHIVNVLRQQDLRTSYDSNLVRAQLAELEDIVSQI